MARITADVDLKHYVNYDGTVNRTALIEDLTAALETALYAEPSIQSISVMVKLDGNGQPTGRVILDRGV